MCGVGSSNVLLTSATEHDVITGAVLSYHTFSSNDDVNQGGSLSASLAPSSGGSLSATSSALVAQSDSLSYAATSTATPAASAAGSPSTAASISASSATSVVVSPALTSSGLSPSSGAVSPSHATATASGNSTGGVAEDDNSGDDDITDSSGDNGNGGGNSQRRLQLSDSSYIAVAVSVEFAVVPPSGVTQDTIAQSLAQSTGATNDAGGSNLPPAPDVIAALQASNISGTYYSLVIILHTFSRRPLHKLCPQ
jgi:hypothetical protein